MTTTPPTADDDLIQLVRSADPLDGHELAPAGAPDTILQQILAEPRPQRRRKTVLRRAVAVRLLAAGAAVAVAIVAVMAPTGDDGGGVPTASAAVVHHAIAAASPRPDTILHVDVIGTQDNGDGTAITWRDQSWQASSAPYDRRQIETTPDGTTVESGSAGGDSQVYDPRTDTIYTSTSTGSSHTAHSLHAQAQRRFWLSPGPTANTYKLRLPVFVKRPGHRYKTVPGGPRETVVVTRAQVRAIRNGSDTIKWERVRPAGGGHARFTPVVVAASAQTTAAPSCDDFGSQELGDQILTLLRSCGAHLVGHATIDGRDTLELRSRDAHITYYVDATSYAPVRLDTTGTDGGTSLRFVTYEVLPAGDANDALLSLAAQHPSAAIDRNLADYQAAEKRLFPDG